MRPCFVAGVEASGKLRAKLWEDCQKVLGQVSESLDGLDQCLQVCKTGSTEDCKERCHARPVGSCGCGMGGQMDIDGQMHRMVGETLI